MSLLFWTAVSFHIPGLVFCSHRGAGEDSVRGREEAKRGRQKPSFIQNRLSWSFLGRAALAVAPALLTFLFYFSLSNIHIALAVDQALCNCSTNLHLILITTQWKRSPFHRWRDQGSQGLHDAHKLTRTLSGGSGHKPQPSGARGHYRAWYWFDHVGIALWFSKLGLRSLGAVTWRIGTWSACPSCRAVHFLPAPLPPAIARLDEWKPSGSYS